MQTTSHNSFVAVTNLEQIIRICVEPLHSKLQAKCFRQDPGTCRSIHVVPQKGYWLYLSCIPRTKRILLCHLLCGSIQQVAYCKKNIWLERPLPRRRPIKRATTRMSRPVITLLPFPFIQLFDFNSQGHLIDPGRWTSAWKNPCFSVIRDVKLF